MARDPNHRIDQMNSPAETLYLKSTEFDGRRLSITLTGNSGHTKKIMFSFVRLWLFFKETDFWSDIARYEKRDQNGQVFEISSGGLLREMIIRYSEDDRPHIYGVWTPDECFEVAAFDWPEIESFQTNPDVV
jgi:hypothetical protein